MEHSWLENPSEHSRQVILPNQKHTISYWFHCWVRIFIYVCTKFQDLILKKKTYLPSYHLLKGWLMQWTPKKKSKNVASRVFLRKFQHTPGGTYHEPLKEILHFLGLLGYLGYVPGVCWNFLTSVSLHRKKTHKTRFGAMKCLYALARGPEYGIPLTGQVFWWMSLGWIGKILEDFFVVKWGSG